MRQQGMSLGDILETLPSRKREQRSQVIEFPKRRGDRAVEGARLEIVCTVNPVPRVRIPPSPPNIDFGSALPSSKLSRYNGIDGLPI